MPGDNEKIALLNKQAIFFFKKTISYRIKANQQIDCHFGIFTTQAQRRKPNSGR
jgi:hypothetical protein